jgi:UDP-N-acetylglucosamine/UDP-N-acetylgalactosamine diphosphorylase
MTSHQNHAATEAFFAEHGFRARSGAGAFFPAGPHAGGGFFSGKDHAGDQGALALSPDGHGGSLRALERSGALDLMQREGIDTLSYFQVDNPLVRASIPPSSAGTCSAAPR